MIFLSYRTEDAVEIVDLLDDRLSAELGENMVFRDRTRIDPGAPWRQEIDDNARARKIMLAVIGPTWHRARRKDGRSRARPSIRDPDDWVRREILIARDAGNTIIPVLVNRTRKPRPTLLDEAGLGFLFDIQQAVLRSSAFGQDVEKLIEDLTRRFPDLGPSFATFAADAAASHAQSMADRTQARQRYGQALTLLAPDARGVPGGGIVERRAALGELDRLATAARAGRKDARLSGPRPLVILGNEGNGKTWLAAAWCRRQVDRVLVFVSSIRDRNRPSDDNLLPTYCMDLVSRERIASSARAWRAWFSRERFRSQATGRLIVVVDGVNEAPLIYWPGLLGQLWRELAAIDGQLVVTCRPSYWRTDIETREIDWPEPVEYELGGFDDDELSRALAARGRTPADLPPRLRDQLRNPRAFALAMELLDELPPDIELGIDRLLFHYWDHRCRDRPDLEQLPRHHYWAWLASHAGEFHDRRLALVGGPHAGSPELESDEHRFDPDTLLARFPGIDEARRDPRAEALLGELRDGRIFEDRIDEFAHRYVFRSAALGFALGLYVVRQLQDQIVQIRGDDDQRTRQLREVLDALLEPVADFDHTAGQMLAASTVACVSNVHRVVRKVVLDGFLRLRNKPEALRPEFEALATDAPEAFADVLDDALDTIHPDAVDAWLVNGLRRAYRGGPRRREAIDSLHSWLVPSRATVADLERAEVRSALAARIVAGEDLAPLARALLDWAADTVSGDRSAAPYGAPLRESPVVQLVRCDLRSPAALERAILTALDGPCAPGSPNETTAAARLCAALATPAAADRAESSAPGTLSAVDPPDRRDATEGRDAATDPAAPEPFLDDHWLSWLAAAARESPDAFVVAARSTVRDVAGSPDALQWLQLMPSAATLLGGEAIEQLGHLPFDIREWLLESQLAAAPGDAGLTDGGMRAFQAMAWEESTGEGLPRSATRWRPVLRAADLDALLDKLPAPLPPRQLRDDTILSSFLGEIAAHPIEGLGERARARLRALMLGSGELAFLRGPAMRIAAAAHDAELAEALFDSRWSAAHEPETAMAAAGSELLVTALAGRAPIAQIAERIASDALPRLAERCRDDELAELIMLLSAAFDETTAGPSARRIGPAMQRPARISAARELGARRLWRADPVAVERWLAAMSRDEPSAHAAVANNFGLSLAAAVGSRTPAAAAHGFVRSLLRRRAQLTGPFTANRPPSLPLLRAALAVAGAAGSAGAELLDLLVLATSDDRSLASLAGVAVDLSGPALDALVAWIDRGLADGPVARTAYGLTLSGLLAAFAPGLASALEAWPARAGFLGNVAAFARATAHHIACADHWSGFRIRSTSLPESAAAEFLALACDPAMVPPAVRAWQPTAALDQLFRCRVANRVYAWRHSERRQLHGQSAPAVAVVVANALAAHAGR